MRRTTQYTDFGLWLHMELIKRNLTSREFAELAGLNFRVISDVMTGRNKSHKEEIKEVLRRYDKEQLEAV